MASLVDIAGAVQGALAAGFAATIIHKHLTGDYEDQKQSSPSSMNIVEHSVSDQAIQEAKQRAEAARARAAAAEEGAISTIADAEKALASALANEEQAQAGLEAVVGQLSAAQASGAGAAAVLHRNAKRCETEEAALLSCYQAAYKSPGGAAATLDCAPALKAYALCAKQATNQ